MERPIINEWNSKRCSVNGIGLTEAVVQQAGDRRIVVELPGETDPEAALATLQQTGLLEFVDMSSLDQNQAATLVGKDIQTDYGISTTENPAATQTITPTQGITTTETVTPTFHTVMTGADLQTVQVEASQQSGSYQVAFKLTPDGAKIFADFTASHVGDVLAIVLDKQVISTPVINSAIPDGAGVISGNFKRIQFY